MEQQLLTVKEVARRLKVSISMAYKLIGTGELPSYKIKTALRVSEKHLMKYLRSCQQTRNVAEEKPQRRCKLKHISL